VNRLLIHSGVPALLLFLAACPSAGTKRDPKLSETHYLLGSDYMKKKMPQLAKRELIMAVELDPDNLDAHELLGVLFFFEGVNKVNILERNQCLTGVAADEQRQEANREFRRCEEHLVKVIKLAEKDKKVESDALNYLANVSLHFKRYDEAINRAKKALSNILYVSRHLALGTLGWAYYQKGNLVAAARELRQSIFHEPRFCVGRYRLAKVYYDQKDYDAAIKELKRVVDDKACPIQEAYHLLGLALMKKKDPGQAKIEFDSCVKLNPNSCISEECRRYAKLI
jgi:type IV pilus assembly protein PilF